uniref:AP2/ERF domain-containing protein n=1 Tax=Oryza meridionalis TaxID=40149 RepID=A0A0E0E4N3_9ORYZ
MDMDMSSAYPHHWLSFSLSNNYHHGLLEALSTTSAPPLGEEGPAEGAPKMEDFLGGLGGGGGAVAAAPAAAPEDQLSCGELGSIAAGFLRRYPPPENAGGKTAAAATSRATATPKTTYNTKWREYYIRVDSLRKNSTARAACDLDGRDEVLGVVAGI